MKLIERGLAGAIAVLSCAALVIGQAPASVWDGVYSEEQAARGLTAYNKICGTCHGDALEGAGVFPPLAGDDFKANWNGQHLSDLFERIRITMPADHPGTLTGAQNADILAYILEKNEFPAGSSPLASEANALKAIRFDAAKPSK